MQDIIADQKEGMNASEQIKKFHSFLEEYYYSKILENLRKDNKFVVVDFAELSKFDIDLASHLLEDPEEAIKAAELATAQFDVENIHNFRVRFTNLPQSQNIMVRNIRSKHIGKLVYASGIVRQKSDVRPQVTAAKFECPVCGNVINVLQLDGNFKEPSKCGCGRKGKFTLLSKELVDAQGIVLEESPESLEGGEQPKRINVLLKDDLVSPLSEKKTNPGSKITVIGIIKEVPIILKTGSKSTRFDLMIESNYIGSIEESLYELEITPEEEQKIVELSKDPNLFLKLIDSTAPSIYGYEKVKESLLLQLVGGVRKVRSDKVVSRGDMHILLVGDPGSGKSVMLKRISTISPKGRYVSGKGVSGAGLTASVVRDEFLKGWSLEAGALVLASDGICCIDEMDKMSPEDRAAMHEALEQQCLHHDSIITLANGEEKVIGKFVDELMDIYKDKAIEGRNCLILPIENLNIEMLTTDWEHIHKTKINRVSKHIAPNHFIKITLGNGRSITVTPEHPFFCVKNGKIITKRADEVGVGDWAPVPLKVPIEGNKQFFIIDKSKVYSKRASQHIIIPQSNCEEFFKIVGYMVSEGSKELNRGKLIGVNFANKDPILLQDFSDSMKSLFGLRPYKQARVDEYGTRWMLRYISRELTSFFEIVCPTLLEKASRKELPQVVMRAESANVSKMLRCMFEGDGHVSKKLRTIRIGYGTNSKRLAEQVQDLLLRFSIRSNLTEHKETYKVSITGYENIFRFKEHIGFISNNKNNIIEDYLIEKSPIRTVKDVVPNISEAVVSLLEKYKINSIGNYSSYDIKWDHTKRGFNFSRKFLQKVVDCIKNKVAKEDENVFDNLRKFAYGEIGFEKIRRVERIQNNDQKWAYDVTIEPNHTFISQNMVLHNTVSISKANIQATLISRTTVLAAANPKFGRFDPYGIIAEQIDLPPTLINRFDLIFTIKDIPDESKDEKMATHILKLHQKPDLYEPELPTEFLRKYVAYAKQKITPRITDGALEEIKSFYLKMRSSGSTEGGIKAIPISARQLEALVRLTEASAKLRLSQEATEEDARRAIQLVEYCLMQVGLDRETGKIDIDRIATGISASQRSHIIVIKDIIADLESKVGKIIPIDDVMEEAKNRGVSEDKAEEVLEKLKRVGEVFEPRRGFLSKI